jgi:peptidyl-prolyl cis-trans isomerase C
MNSQGRIVLGVSVFAITALAAAGCEDIKNAFQVKPLPAGKTTSASAPGVAEPQVHGTVLAKVNDSVITLESFDEKVKALRAMSPDSKIDTYDGKKDLLNRIVTQDLFYQEARARGIDKKKDISDAVEEFRKGVMTNQLIMDETKGINVEPSEIEQFYSQYKQAFAVPEQARVREIVVSSEAAAKEILISLLNGGDFASIAQEKSKAASAAKGGDVGFFEKADKFDKYNEVVATLEPGQISQIFMGPGGYHIVKVEERKGGGIPQMTDRMPNSDMTVYDQIKEGLLQQKHAQRIQDMTDRLKRDAKIEMKEDLLR